MAAHTPGPWATAEERGSDGCVVYLSVNPVLADFVYRGSVCSVHDAEHIDGITKSERDANARLIAAAPDLLAALREAEAALEVAIGRMMQVGNVPPRDFKTSEQLALVAVRAAIAKATGSAA